ncbi:hypothetical protein BGX31_001557 [Mortierella sp. GBA43]|nr:hypothetical protein BGX31_001557 [Mortierella sp. GBA43]
MVWKNSAILLLLAAAAVPVLAEEPSNCQIPKIRNNVTAIVDENNFCTMLPPMGVSEVAPSEACATSYCVGNPAATKEPKELAANPKMPKNNETTGYVQITGCFDPLAWKLSPTDGGGQMDSHGWRYRCDGYGKFLSLLEPTEGQYCIRCCKGGDKDPDCDTSHSTRGCWNLIPGQYTMPDGSNCPRPPGAPAVVLPSPTGTAPGTAPSTPAGGVAPPAGGNPPAAGGNTPTTGTNPATPNNGGNTNTNAPKGAAADSSSTKTTGSAGSHITFSLQTVGLFAAGAMALAAAF